MVGIKSLFFFVCFHAVVKLQYHHYNNLNRKSKYKGDKEAGIFRDVVLNVIRMKTVCSFLSTMLLIVHYTSRVKIKEQPSILGLHMNE